MSFAGDLFDGDVRLCEDSKALHDPFGFVGVQFARIVERHLCLEVFDTELNH